MQIIKISLESEENFTKTAKFSGEPFENSLSNTKKVNYSKFSEVDKKGCSTAPNKVLAVLKGIGSNEHGDLIDYNKLNIEEIHVNSDNFPEAEHLIFENSKEIFERNFKSFFIGGDHSISYPILKAFNKVEENPLLIVFDAHADCLTGKEGFNRNWLRRLIEGGFNTNSIIIIGIRNISFEEIEFLNENKILLIKMDILREDLEGVCDLMMERALNSSGFYISIDIDGVDPGFAPGTLFIEPGGLSSSDLIYFARRLRLLNNFRGADVCEINPALDFNNMTVKLGAKLLSEMI